MFPNPLASIRGLLRLAGGKIRHYGHQYKTRTAMASRKWKRAILQLEALEERWCLALYTWTDAKGDGLWTTLGNWSWSVNNQTPTVLPGANDSVVFDPQSTNDSCHIPSMGIAGVEIAFLQMDPGYMGTLDLDGDLTLDKGGDIEADPDGGVSGSGNLTVQGDTLKWVSGKMSGDASGAILGVDNAGILLIPANASQTLILDGRDIQNNGNISYEAENTLSLRNGATIRNSEGGIFTFDAGITTKATIDGSQSPSSSFQITDSASSMVDNVSFPGSTVIINTPLVDNFGTVTIAGNLQAQAGAIITGDGQNTNVNIAGDFYISLGPTITNQWNGAVFSGNGYLGLSGGGNVQLSGDNGDNVIQIPNLTENTTQSFVGTGNLDIGPGSVFIWKGNFNSSGALNIASGGNVDVEGGIQTVNMVNGGQIYNDGTIQFFTGDLTLGGGVIITNVGSILWGQGPCDIAYNNVVPAPLSLTREQSIPLARK